MWLGDSFAMELQLTRGYRQHNQASILHHIAKLHRLQIITIDIKKLSENFTSVSTTDPSFSYTYYKIIQDN
jgi:hypothetical protein